MLYSKTVPVIVFFCKFGSFSWHPEINGGNNCRFGDDMSSVNNQEKRVLGNSAQLNEWWRSACPALLEPVEAKVQRGRFLFFHRITQALFWLVSLLWEPWGFAIITKQREEGRGHGLIVCGVCMLVGTFPFFKFSLFFMLLWVQLQNWIHSQKWIQISNKSLSFCTNKNLTLCSYYLFPV